MTFTIDQLVAAWTRIVDTQGRDPVENTRLLLQAGRPVPLEASSLAAKAITSGINASTAVRAMALEGCPVEDALKALVANGDGLVESMMAPGVYRDAGAEPTPTAVAMAAVNMFGAGVSLPPMPVAVSLFLSGYAPRDVLACLVSIYSQAPREFLIEVIGAAAGLDVTQQAARAIAEGRRKAVPLATSMQDAAKGAPSLTPGTLAAAAVTGSIPSAAGIPEVVAGLLLSFPSGMAPLDLANAVTRACAASDNASVSARALVCAYASQAGGLFVVAQTLRTQGFDPVTALDAILATGQPRDMAQRAVAKAYGLPAPTLLDLTQGGYVTTPYCEGYLCRHAYEESIGPIVDPCTEFTFEAWMRIVPGPRGLRSISPLLITMSPAFAGAPDVYGLGWRVGSPWRLEQGRTPGTPSGWVGVTEAAGPNVSDGKWHHVAVATRNVNGGVRTEFYLDGQLLPVQGSPDSPTPPYGFPFLSIASPYGMRPEMPWMSDDFYGYVREVRFWRGARSGDQIRETMNTSFDQPQPGLMGYWPFTDGTTNDKSGLGYNGTLVGKAAIIPNYDEIP